MSLGMVHPRVALAAEATRPGIPCVAGGRHRDVRSGVRLGHRPATARAVRGRQDGPAGDARGFTLIELMVVLVLVAILTALILPELRGSHQSELLRSTGRELLRAMHLAYSQTITLHQGHRVRIDAQAGRYLVERAAPDRAGATGFVPVHNLPGSQGTLDPRISIELRTSGASAGHAPDPAVRTTAPHRASTAGPDLTIAFYPDGTSEPKEIVLRDRDGFGFALRVHPVTARVSLVELERKGRP
jgi:type II secretion system protein H